jgi:Ran GTPase-activating protein (RanGAP) involved in mRNA processing and transport
MTVIPIPATLDLADRMDGDEFEVTTLVRRKGNELEVVTIEGEPVAAMESEDEGDDVEVEMDAEAFDRVLKGGPR